MELLKKTQSSTTTIGDSGTVQQTSTKTVVEKLKKKKKRNRWIWISLIGVVLLLIAACSDGDDDLTLATTGSTMTTVASTPGVTSAPAATNTSTVTEPIVTTAVPETAASATTQPALAPGVAPACPPLTLGTSETTLTAGGATHPVRIFVASAYAGSPLPVVLNWHGLGSNGPDQAMYSGYESVAESEGFIVVHPTGVADSVDGPNSWQLFPAPDRERDDLAFAGALIDELVANWCADPGRVYSTGMSNGGFFTAPHVLEPGENSLIVKVWEGGGDWNFALRFQDEAGEPITQGLEVRKFPAGVCAVPPLNAARSVETGETVLVQCVEVPRWSEGETYSVTIALSDVRAPSGSCAAPLTVRIEETVPDGWTPSAARQRRRRRAARFQCPRWHRAGP